MSRVITVEQQGRSCWHAPTRLETLPARAGEAVQPVLDRLRADRRLGDGSCFLRLYDLRERQVVDEILISNT